MDVYTTFTPDPLWVVLALGGVGSLIAGKWGRSMVGPVVSRWLLIAGVVLLVGLFAQSLLMTWFVPPGATK